MNGNTTGVWNHIDPLLQGRVWATNRTGTLSLPHPKTPQSYDLKYRRGEQAIYQSDVIEKMVWFSLATCGRWWSRNALINTQNRALCSRLSSSQQFKRWRTSTDRLTSLVRSGIFLTHSSIASELKRLEGRHSMEVLDVCMVICVNREEALMSIWK